MKDEKTNRPGIKTGNRLKLLGVLLVLSCSTQNGLASDNLVLAKEHYFNGVKHYIKRDFKSATEEFMTSLKFDPENDRTKRYMLEAQEKFQKSLSLFFEGIASFKKEEYDAAMRSFEQSLMINPIDERTKYYLKLCYPPDFSVTSGKEMETTDESISFISHIDTSMTIPNWIEKWELKIEDAQGKTVRSIEGAGNPPDIIDWDLKDNSGRLCLNQDVGFYMELTSLYGRKVSSERHKTVIERKKAGNIVLEIPEVLFKYGKAEFLVNNDPVLDEAVNTMKKYPDARFIVAGYADDEGAEDFNQKLSEKRAKSVYNYLKIKTDFSEIYFKGYGESRPKVPNDTEENRQKNRRVEIIIIR